jgi:hypothetical protein
MKPDLQPCFSLAACASGGPVRGAAPGAASSRTGDGVVYKTRRSDLWARRAGTNFSPLVDTGRHIARLRVESAPRRRERRVRHRAPSSAGPGAQPCLTARREPSVTLFDLPRLPRRRARRPTSVRGDPHSAGNACGPRTVGRARLPSDRAEQSPGLPAEPVSRLAWFGPRRGKRSSASKHRRQQQPRANFACWATWSACRRAGLRPSTGPRPRITSPFGAPVLAPGDGVVVEARGDFDDPAARTRRQA